jgi:two-component system phosphate regulon response regulator PhoB
MMQAATILLTQPNPALVEAVRARRPDLRALAIGSRLPGEAFRGPVYGFIDWLLPDISGLELCRRLRQAENMRHARLTMVLEAGDVDARRRALLAGADDYVTAPLTPETLLERIGGDHPSAPTEASALYHLQHGHLRIDLVARQVLWRGRPVRLGTNEFRLLVHLVENPDRVFSRSTIIERLGKPRETISPRTVDVWISRVRRALRAAGAPDPFRSVSKFGYVLDSPPASE